MRSITLIGTFGLTDEQIAVIVMWGGYAKKDADTYDEKWEPCTMDGTLTDGGDLISKVKLPKNWKMTHFILMQ